MRGWGGGGGAEGRVKGENLISGRKASLPTCRRIRANWGLSKHRVPGTSPGVECRPIFRHDYKGLD